MIHKALQLIHINDLQGLCDRKVREGTQLDYKDELPHTNDEGKKEFLRDVTALANTDGGDLIYGLREERDGDEKTAIAGKVIGVEDLKFDEKRLWMENLVRDNTEPRLLGVGFHPVAIDEKHTALIVRVPRSWNGPHVVSYGNHWRFYARNSAGKYPMDVAQLRDAFLASSSLHQKLEDFRSRRLETLNIERPVGRACLVIHLQPFDSSRRGFELDTSKAGFLTDNLLPGSALNAHPRARHNFDGLQTRIGDDSLRYVQIYRSGIVEEVDSVVLNEKSKNQKNVIDAIELERVLFRAVGRRLALLKGLGVLAPVMLQISLLGVRHFKLKARMSGYGGIHLEKVYEDEIDRDDLILPGLLIDNLPELELEGPPRIDGSLQIYKSWDTAQSIIQPLLDIVWNAAGLARCLHYDGTGKWRGMISE